MNKAVGLKEYLLCLFMSNLSVLCFGWFWRKQHAFGFVIQLLEGSRRLKRFSPNVCIHLSGFRETHIRSLSKDLNVLIYNLVYKICEYEGVIWSFFPPIYSSLKCNFIFELNWPLYFLFFLFLSLLLFLF